jgi:hypothetical protein
MKKTMACIEFDSGDTVEFAAVAEGVEILVQPNSTLQGRWVATAYCDAAMLKAFGDSAEEAAKNLDDGMGHIVKAMFVLRYKNAEKG